MKKQVKKLALGKMTISNLNPTEMSQKIGGLSGGCLSPDRRPTRPTSA